VFHKQLDAAPGYELLRVFDLTQGRTYRLQARAQKLRIGQFGALVKHVAPVNLNPNGVVLRTVDRHYLMDDGVQEMTVSAAALESGIVLLPLFRGTGYDQNQRTQLDYGSSLYIIEAEK
jgi:alpha-galactosidase